MVLDQATQLPLSLQCSLHWTVIGHGCNHTMNIANTLNQLKAEIALKEAQIAVLHRLAERLPDDHNVSISHVGVDIDQPQSRETVTRIMQALGAGSWDKELCGDDGKVNYITKGFHPIVKVRLWNAPPPASCRIVEEVVEVPAQPATTRKVRKLVCVDPETAAVE